MPSTLALGAALEVGQTLMSEFGLCTLTFNGNLVLTFNGRQKPVTGLAPGGNLLTLAAGNGLVITDPVLGLLWNPAPGPMMGLQVLDNGLVVLYSPAGQVAWSAGF